MIAMIFVTQNNLKRSRNFRPSPWILPKRAVCDGRPVVRGAICQRRGRVRIDETAKRTPNGMRGVMVAVEGKSHGDDVGLNVLRCRGGIIIRDNQVSLE